MRGLLLLALPLLACKPADPGPFGEDFMWGTASAAWQAEGDHDPDPSDGFDVHSNWSVWTERGCVIDGQTNDEGAGFYTRYAEDFALAASIGNNSYRLTIDWTRVEPEDDQWNDAEVQHYVDVLQAMTDAGLTPMVTLFHWVMPTWLQNPVEGPDFVDHLGKADAGPDAYWVAEFEEFVRYVAPHLAPFADLYSIVNEPFSVIAVGYLNGGCGQEAFPPGGTLDLDGARRSAVNLVFGHAAACHALRELDTIDMDGDGQAALCGDAASNNLMVPLDDGDELDESGVARLDWIYNHLFMAAMIDGDVDLDFDGEFTTLSADNPDLPIDEGYYPELAGTLDWHGINYYGPIAVQGLPGGALGGIPLVAVEDYDPSLPASELGFAIDAGGFGTILDRFAEYGLPIYITENGLGDSDDSDRPRFLVEHVAAVQDARDRGVDVRGYYHWSLTDNFEWAHGFHQRFGLFRVDFDDPTLPRIRQGSVDAYEAIITAGEVTEDAWSTWASAPYSTGGGR
jgi:beta-glucosidase/6-phospho-beta-glucosidase/beta-galactosidase